MEVKIQLTQHPKGISQRMLHSCGTGGGGRKPLESDKHITVNTDSEHVWNGIWSPPASGFMKEKTKTKTAQK